MLRRVLLTLFGLLASVQVVAQLVDAARVAELTQVLLVLPLVGYVVASPRWHGRAWLIAAMIWCWLGDSLPRLIHGDLGFLVMVGCFLIAQICFIVTFWPPRRGRLLVAPLIGYPVVGLVLVGLCWQGAETLRPAVLVYACCLTVMAVLAWQVHPLVRLGGALFLLSDALIAIRSFTETFSRFPAAGFWVMLTYCAALGLIVIGTVSARSESADRR